MKTIIQIIILILAIFFGFILGNIFQFYTTGKEIIWESIIGGSSVFIALCAFILAIYNSYKTKEYSQLSLRPKLTEWTYFDTDTTGKYAITYQYVITNRGLGPAYIKSFDLYVDGQQLPGDDEQKIRNAASILLSGYPYKITTVSSIGNNHVIQSNETVEILTINFDLKKPIMLAHLKSLGSRIRLKIVYESIYNEQFEI